MRFHPLWPRLRTNPRCGNVNALRRKEIVTLRPGRIMKLRSTPVSLRSNALIFRVR